MIAFHPVIWIALLYGEDYILFPINYLNYFLKRHKAENVEHIPPVLSSYSHAVVKCSFVVCFCAGTSIPKL